MGCQRADGFNVACRGCARCRPSRTYPDSAQSASPYLLGGLALSVEGAISVWAGARPCMCIGCLPGMSVTSTFNGTSHINLVGRFDDQFPQLGCPLGAVFRCFDRQTAAGGCA